MAIVEHREYMPLAMEEDPDDWRPESKLAVVIDPTSESGDHVEGLTVFYERIAGGDKIPLHVHDCEEVFFVDEGSIEATVGEETRVVGPGVTVFIPSRTPHGFRNLGDDVARIHAAFPTRRIGIRYLERNPAPGTEGEDPQPPISIDVRHLAEGRLEEAVRPMDASEFE